MWFLSYISSVDKHTYERTFLQKKSRPYFHRYDEWSIEQIHEIQELGLDSYYERALKSWHSFILASKDIDEFLQKNHLYEEDSWKWEVWDQVMEKLKIAFEREHERNIFSIWLKEKVEYAIKKIIDWSMATIDISILMKPSHPTFHMQYYFDHLQWYANMQWGQNFKVTKEGLIHLYHLWDEQLFEIRLSNFRFHLLDRTKEKNSTQCSSFLSQSEEFRSIKEVVMSTREDIRVVDKLLELDNWDEFVWGYQLTPLPDFVLRDGLIKYLRRIGKMTDVNTTLNTSYEQFRQAYGA